MIVCLNKMDEKTVNYSEDRYEEIKKEVTDYLKKSDITQPKFHSSQFQDGTEIT